jgi:transposase
MWGRVDSVLDRVAAHLCGRKIRLVCDHGRFHTTKAVQQFFTAHHKQLAIYWFPPYCPSLNLTERLWGHIKRTVLANVLYQSLDDLVRALRTGVGRVSGHRERMGFMFKHGDIPQTTPRPLLNLAA